DDKSIDILKEIGNIGIGNAATSLSRMIDKKVMIDLPETYFCHMSKFAELLGGPEKLLVCINLPISGDFTGQSVFVFAEDTAKMMSEMLMGTPCTELKDMELSSLKELGNIFMGSYLNATAQMLQCEVLPQPPSVSYDFAQSVMDPILISFAHQLDQILVIKTEFSINEQAIDGTFLLLVDNVSLDYIFGKIKQIFGE
ncbi:MAG: chemotaxis protein CheC, partial [Candidatus Woesearchaeota archaeon]